MWRSHTYNSKQAQFLACYCSNVGVDKSQKLPPACKTLAVIMLDKTDKYIGLDQTMTNTIMRTQVKPDLCWAAGIQMLLLNENLRLTQEQIVQQVLDINSLDDEYDRRISGEEIGTLLMNIKISFKDKTRKLTVTELPNNFCDENILTTLSKHKPILLSYNKKSNSQIGDPTYAHIVVISGANYFVSNDIKTIRQLIVLDPVNTIDTVKQTYEKNDLKDILTSINVLWTIDVA